MNTAKKGSDLDWPSIDRLLTEATLISGKIEATVDRLWRLRSICLTFWLACTTVGLGNFSNTRSVQLMLASCIIPVFFFYIDARYNRWYRRLSSRDKAISDYLNGRIEPKDGAMFPLYDPGYFIPGSQISKAQVQGNDEWRFSLLRNLVDPIPLIFFGLQIAGSALLLFTFFGDNIGSE